MLTVPAPITPKHLKCVLELAGFTVVAEDEWNWSLLRGVELPIILPKDGEFVAVEVMENALYKADIVLGKYLPLKAEAAKQLGIAPN